MVLKITFPFLSFHNFRKRIDFLRLPCFARKWKKLALNKYAYSLPAAQKSHSGSNGKARKLMLQRKIIASFCDMDV